MNKKTIGIVAFVVIGIVAVGVFALSTSDSSTPQSTQNTTPIQPSETDISSANNLEQQPIQPGTYITLSERDANPTNYATTKQVYFFHAEWCPICKGIDAEIEANPEKIPAGVTLIRTDFDANRDLRQQYGVTYQYTFVQIDQNGNEVAQWTADTLDKALAGIN